MIPSIEAVKAHEARGGLWRPVIPPHTVRGVLRQKHTVALRLYVGVDEGRPCVMEAGGASLRAIVGDGNNRFLVGAPWVPVEV